MPSYQSVITQSDNGSEVRRTKFHENTGNSQTEPDVLKLDRRKQIIGSTRIGVSTRILRSECDEGPVLCQLKDIIFGRWISYFLVFIPFAWGSHHFTWSASYIFWLNFLAMCPLASILGEFTEEVAAHTNQVVGGLINATFGNAVELVVAINALNAGEIRVVQSSMLGSIFSNLLLVLGCCFFCGGLKKEELRFNTTMSSANISLLALSSVAFVLPTPYAKYYEVDEDVNNISRAAAIFLIIMYAQLLIFQLKTHAHIMGDEAGEQASIPMYVALTGLVIVTAAIAVLSGWLVDSIDEFTAESGINKTFIGMIILPVVGNAVEHITAVSVAMKDKMDLAMGVAVGSATQICLFVVPFVVIYGWIIGQNMTLHYPPFEIFLYILSLWIVSLSLSNGNGNWLLGSLLISTYLMVALGFWYEEVIDF